MFSADFLTVLVYGSLIWCTVSAGALLTMLVRDIAKGESW